MVPNYWPFEGPRFKTFTVQSQSFSKCCFAFMHEGRAWALALSQAFGVMDTYQLLLLENLAGSVGTCLIHQSLLVELDNRQACYTAMLCYATDWNCRQKVSPVYYCAVFAVVASRFSLAQNSVSITLHSHEKNWFGCPHRRVKPNLVEYWKWSSYWCAYFDILN